ncbi:MAG: hypothetical protein ACYTF6_14360 [Planctomycetota bacterium]|jgi:hypothetical protein
MPVPPSWISQINWADFSGAFRGAQEALGQRRALEQRQREFAASQELAKQTAAEERRQALIGRRQRAREFNIKEARAQEAAGRQREQWQVEKREQIGAMQDESRLEKLERGRQLAMSAGGEMAQRALGVCDRGLEEVKTSMAERSGRLNTWKSFNEIEQRAAMNAAAETGKQYYRDPRFLPELPDYRQRLQQAEQEILSVKTGLRKAGAPRNVINNIPLGRRAEGEAQIRLMNAYDTMGALRYMEKNVDPTMFGLRGKATRGIYGAMDWLSPGLLGEDDRVTYEAHEKFFTSAEQFFNAYRKHITGAQAAVKELEILRESTISGKGMTWGEFRARVGVLKDKVMREVRLHNRLLATGFPKGTTPDVAVRAMLGTADNFDSPDDEERRFLQLSDPVLNLSDEQIAEQLAFEGY